METSAGISAEDGVQCPSCRRPFSIDLNQAQEEDAAPDISKISTIGLPSLKDLPHVATGMCD